jgi:hypothetical protein
MKLNKKQYQVNIDKEIVEDARERCSKIGMSFSMLLELLLREYLKEDSQLTIKL